MSWNILHTHSCYREMAFSPTFWARTQFPPSAAELLFMSVLCERTRSRSTASLFNSTSLIYDLRSQSFSSSDLRVCHNLYRTLPRYNPSPAWPCNLGNSKWPFCSEGKPTKASCFSNLYWNHRPVVSALSRCTGFKWLSLPTLRTLNSLEALVFRSFSFTTRRSQCNVTAVS